MTLFLSMLMYVAFIGVSYLAGSVNNAIIICRLLGYDIRSLGSGNPGAMNMIRSVGLWWGVLTLVMDALKGALPALAGWFFLGDFCSFEGSRIGACLCGLGVIAGHIFPVYYKFKGGKGVASTLGICMVLNPLLGAPNCHLTPHNAWTTKEARRRLIEIAADNLRAWIAGTPKNIVN